MKESINLTDNVLISALATITKSNQNKELVYLRNKKVCKGEVITIAYKCYTRTYLHTKILIWIKISVKQFHKVLCNWK